MSLNTYTHILRKPAPGAPLVFTFHGTGGNETQIAGLVEQVMPGAGIVSPRGDVSEHGANRFFRRAAEGVYDMEDLAARTARMVEFIRAHRADYPDIPVYGVGYSNGANILASVAFEAPDLFDGVALMHPLIPWEPSANPALKNLSVLITAGLRDPICPMSLTERLHGYFETQGARTDLLTHEGGHEVRPEEIAAVGRFLNQNLPSSPQHDAAIPQSKEQDG